MDFTGRIVVRQLCGSVEADRYWIVTIFVGVLLATAERWLRDLGWRPFMYTHDRGKLRLRLKRRCWVERVGEEATIPTRRQGIVWPAPVEARAALVRARELEALRWAQVSASGRRRRKARA